MDNDLISRQAAIDDLREYKVGPSHFCDESEIECFNDGIDTAISVLATLPSAERRGRWVKDEFGSRCGACGLYAYRDKFDKPWESPYCPNCGARMEVE